MMKRRSQKYNLLFFLFFAIGLLQCDFVAEAKTTFKVTGQCETSPTATIRIRVDAASNYDGFDIYRADETGTYQYVGSKGKVLNTDREDTSDEDGYDDYYDYDDYDYESDWVLEKKKYIEYRTYVFQDTTEVLLVNQSYQYKIVAYRYTDDVKTEIKSQEVTVTILNAGTTLTYGKRSGKLGAKLRWKKVEGADGYYIYSVANYDSKSRYVDVNTNDLSGYKKVKTIKNPNTLSATIKKLKNGVTYTYRVCAYWNVDGKTVTSVMSAPRSVLMNYYSYNGETYQQRIKRAFGSEKKKAKNFKTASKASKQMKKIKIKVWDFKNGKKGKKVTRTKYLTVNKRLAPSIKAMFDEIYKSKEKQVIKDIGCYSYRTGEHMYGMAIDINPNENYMIDGKNILCGSFWKPKKNKYSIPLDCETVRIMERYGFYRGFWGDRKDYMHFSYFGT